MASRDTKVTVRFDAITTAFEAKIARLEGKLENLKGKSKEQGETLSDQFTRHAKVIGKVTGVIAGVTGAVVLATKAANSYLEDARLKAGAAGASLKGLTGATMGLVESDTLLAFAGKAMHGVWKLNQSEMETVLKGATALRKTMGAELQPTVEALTEAVAKGNTQALKQFGIEAKDKSGVLRELSAMYRKLGGDASLAGDSFLASKVEFKNAMDDMMSNLGKLVVSLAPLVKVLAAVTKEIADSINALSSWDALAERAGDNLSRFSDIMLGADDDVGTVDGLGTRIQMQINRDRQRRKAEALAAQQKAWTDAKTAVPDDFRMDSAVPFNVSAETMLDQWDVGFRTDDRFKKKGGAKELGDSRPFIEMAIPLGRLTSALENLPSALIGAGRAAIQGVDSAGRSNDSWARLSKDSDIKGQYGSMSERIGKASTTLQESLAAGKAEVDGKVSFLESIFGAPEEFSIYADAFSLLTGGIQASFGAWIDGSASASEAFKGFVAGGLKSIAVEMLGQAARNTAMGFGALADPFTAALAPGYFTAAAKFAGAAALMGVLAKGMGGGGGASASGGGGGYGAGAYAGGPATRRDNRGDEGSGHNYYINADPLSSNPQALAQQVSRTLANHRRNGRPNGPTIFETI